MTKLAASDIAYKQLEWAVKEKIIIKCYTNRVEYNIFDNKLHPETKKEYKKGKDRNSKENTHT